MAAEDWIDFDEPPLMLDRDYFDETDYYREDESYESNPGTCQGCGGDVLFVFNHDRERWECMERKGKVYHACPAYGKSEIQSVIMQHVSDDFGRVDEDT